MYGLAVKGIGAVTETSPVHYGTDPDSDHFEGIACPKCSSGHVRREERKGFLEERVYSYFGFYPWQCYKCRHKFLYKKRRMRRSHCRAREG